MTTRFSGSATDARTTLTWGRALAVDFLLACKEMRRRTRRSAVALGAVGFGVIALLLASGFIEWIFWAMREGTIRSGLGHIQITRPGYLESGLSDPLSFLLPDGSQEMSMVERLDGVQTVAPRITFHGLISLGEATLSFQGEGLRPDREGPLSTSVVYVAGDPLSENAAENEVLLGQGLAENLGAKLGDTIVLLANTPRGGINAVEATVKGLFSTVTKAYDDFAVRMPLSLAHRLLRVEGSTKWLVLLNDTNDTANVVELLERRLPPQHFSVTPWTALADFYNKTVVLFSKQVAILKLIIAIVVVLAISNTLTIMVTERTTEIGTGMALGATSRAIVRRFLVEGFLLGLVGTAIGLVVGLAAARLISEVGIPMPPPPGMARGYIGEILITPALAFEGVLIAIASCLIGAVFPAWRASRISIVDAIRKRR